MANITQLTCPILIVQGLDDEIVSMVNTLRLQLLLGEECQLELLEGVKHNYKQNNGQEIFNRKALDFLMGVFKSNL